MADDHDTRSAVSSAQGSDTQRARRRRSGSPDASGDAVAAPVTGGGARRRTREGAAPVDPVTAEQQQILFGIFVVMTIGVTFFQKIGYVPNSAFVIPLILPLAYAALGVGLLFARPVFRPERTILYLVLMVVSLLSNILFSQEFSITSMALYAALYAPFMVAFDTTRDTYRRCLNFFSTLMLVFAAIVWIQQAVQFSAGWSYWPDLDKILPRQLLIPKFNYLQPIEWGINLMKPSGIFFLEVSILSQFLTFALVIELLFFRRTWRAIFFGASLFATFAGTGLVLLALSLPVILLRLNTRTFAIILVTVFAALFVALQLHWFDLVAHRIGEFQQTGSSANSRFVAPLDRIREALTHPSAVYAGVGAGMIESGGNTFWWPIVKTTVEYGLIEGILFYVFYFTAMFDQAPSRQMAFVLAIWFSFEGTLLTPLNPLTCVMLASMFHVRTEERGRRRSSSRRAADSPAAARPGVAATAG